MQKLWPNQKRIKMAKDPKYRTVAKAIRLDIDKQTDEFFIVFKITDTSFKQKIRDNWNADVELELRDKELVIKE